MRRGLRARWTRRCQATGRPIVYSLCQYGWRSGLAWGAAVGGNLWRTTGDITDNFDRMATIGFSQAGLAKYAEPGHWNDPDMLEVGNGGMNADEYRTHMSLWAILAAPLLAGNDLSQMTPETLSILTNRESSPSTRSAWATGRPRLCCRAIRGLVQAPQGWLEGRGSL